MWEAMLLATGGLFAPMFVLVTSLILSTDHGREKAITFLCGLTTGYTLVALLTLLAGASLPEGGAGSGGHIARVILGGLFLFLGVRGSIRGPREGQSLDRVLSFRGPRVFVVGGLTSLINFKNLAIFITAISALLPLPLAHRDEPIRLALVSDRAYEPPEHRHTLSRAHVCPGLPRELPPW